MGMPYRVIKTIKGRRYIYEQRTRREGKRVRTFSRYIGPADGSVQRVTSLLAAQRLSREDRAMASAERIAERVAQFQREQFGQTAEERSAREQQEHLDQLYDRYGLTLGPIDPTPVEPLASHADKCAGGVPAGDTRGDHDKATTDPT